jgi:hypothetical protein
LNSTSFIRLTIFPNNSILPGKMEDLKTIGELEDIIRAKHLERNPETAVEAAAEFKRTDMARAARQANFWKLIKLLTERESIPGISIYTEEKGKRYALSAPMRDNGGKTEPGYYYVKNVFDRYFMVVGDMVYYTKYSTANNHTHDRDLTIYSFELANGTEAKKVSDDELAQLVKSVPKITLLSVKS